MVQSVQTEHEHKTSDEKMSIEYLLRVTPEEKASMEKLQVKSKEELKQVMDILKEWWAKQPHLPPLTPGKETL